MTNYNGGRFWQLADDLTGNDGKDNLNSASKQGIVHRPIANSLNVDVEPIQYIDNLFALKTFAGAAGVALPGNQASVFIFIDAANTLQVNITGFPASGFYVALALATTSLTDVLAVTNMQQVSPESPASAGVSTVTANSPLAQSGTPTNPIIDLPDATAGSAGAATAAQIAKLDGIQALAQVVNQTNIQSAGGLHQALFTAIGNMLVGSGVGAVAELVPGVIGTVLTSLGPGVLPQYQAITSFTPQVLIASSIAGIAAGLLAYPSVSWVQLFATGSINIDAVNTNLINLVDAGLYIAVAVMYGNQNNRVHALVFNSPPNPATARGKAFTNLGPAGTTQDVLPIIAGFQGPQQVALETSGTNFGSNGVETSDALRNILIIMKVAN